MEKVAIEIILPILKENFVKKNAKVEMKYLLKFVILTQKIQIECVTEPNLFAFGTAPVKIIASKKNAWIELLNTKMFWVAFKS